MPLPGGENHRPWRAAKERTKAVVVRVLEVGLQDVVVHVGHAELGAHPLQAQGLELQGGQGAGGVLGQGLVNGEGDLLAWREHARDQMLVDDLLGQGAVHRSTPGCGVMAPQF